MEIRKLRPPIFLVTGAPAVGKTTFCQALMNRFERGFHVPIDDLREWVVSGCAHPIGWTDETTRQFLLAETDLNLERNRTRTNKTFSHEVLIPTIEGLNAWYREHQATMSDWLLVPNNGTVEEAVDLVMAHLGSKK